MTDKIDMIWDTVQKMDTKIEKLDDKIDCVCTDVAGLKVKSGVWGALSGLIPVSLGALWLFLRGGHN